MLTLVLLLSPVVLHRRSWRRPFLVEHLRRCTPRLRQVQSAVPTPPHLLARAHPHASPLRPWQQAAPLLAESALALQQVLRMWVAPGPWALAQRMQCRCQTL